MLRDSLNSWLANTYDMASWRKLTAPWPPQPSATWQALAALGHMALLIPEAYGGIGMGPLDLQVVAETVGRYLVVGPDQSTAVLGTDLILRLGSDDQKQTLLPAIADGSLRLAVGRAEISAPFDPFRGTTVAKADGAGLRLTGSKIVVIDAPLADCLLVVASEDGRPVVALVDRDAAGLAVDAYRLIDDRAGADLSFDNTPAQRLGVAGADIRAAVEAAIDLTTTFVCAESVGAMRTAIRLTVEHVKSSKQFGTEIGNFQALRHRIAEMQSEMAAAEAMSLAAAAALEDPAQFAAMSDRSR
ncbi:MAG: acyl-CoA dehydrogenase family protein [Cypionkella sp.]